MSEVSNDGMAIVATLADVESWNADNDAQRWCKAAGREVLRHLDGISLARLEAAREEYCDLYPRAKHTVDAKAKGGVSKSVSTADFVGNRVFPPIFIPLREAAERISQLKMLGAYPADGRLQIDVAAVAVRHAEKFKGLL